MAVAQPEPSPDPTAADRDASGREGFLGGERLRLIIDALPVLVAYIDAERRYRFCNRAYQTWFGLSPEAVVGRGVWEIAGEEAYAAVRPRLDAAYAGEVVTYEATVPYPIGLRHIRCTYVPDRASDGTVHGVAALVEDITARHEVERERTRLAEQVEAERSWLQHVLRRLPAGVIIRSVDGGRLLAANDEAARILGQPLAGDTSSEALAAYGFRRPDGRPLPPEDYPLMHVLRTGEPVHEELAFDHPDGRRMVLQVDAGPLADADGRMSAAVLTFSDITDRRHASDALRFLSEASAALGTSLDYEATLATVARLAVPALADWCAIDLAEPDGTLRRLVVTHTEPSREAFAWELERRYPTDPAKDEGSYRVLRTGEPILVPEITDEMLAASARDPEYLAIIRGLGLVSYIGVPLVAHGEVFGVLTLVASLSGRRFGEPDLRLAEELGKRAGVAVDNARRHHAAIESLNMLDAALAAAPVGQAFVDRELRYVRINAMLAGLTGLPEDVAGRGYRVGDLVEGWGPRLRPLFERVFATGVPVLNQTLATRLPGPRDAELLASLYPVRDAGGAVRWVGISIIDVTEQRRAERELRASEQRLRGVVESPLIGIGFYDRGGAVTGANQALLDLLGWTREEIEAGALRWDTNLTAPEHRHLDNQAGLEVARSGVSRPYEKELVRKDGTRVPVLAGGARLDESGQTGVFFLLDLTERRRVAEAAQAAQRLEAVGRLAGGVAHEFNNALQGVLGFGTFALRRLAAHDPARVDVEQALRAGERAAKIAQQLLAYSRRQVLQPIDLDLVHLVGEFSLMLRQALGPDRHLVLKLPSGAAVVHADRGQLEQVLLNLTLNARDALAANGRLTVGVERRRLDRGAIAASGGPELAPGEYVQLTVADDGAGMDRETQARVFEPFFTTKAPGQGTGLGLSVVQGIVQQSGGQVWLESEPGRGTTFRILLPAAHRPGTTTGEHEVPASPGGHETVLVVDDEPSIRAFVATVLEEAGYRVLEAAEGHDAFALLAAAARAGGHGADLVITDLVMPGVGGRALGEELARHRPDVPVLYISGYTGDEVVRRGLVSEGAEFLQKPFTTEALLGRVRTILDRRGPPAADRA